MITLCCTKYNERPQLGQVLKVEKDKATIKDYVGDRQCRCTEIQLESTKVQTHGETKALDLHVLLFTRHPDCGPMRSTYLSAEPVTRTLVTIA